MRAKTVNEISSDTFKSAIGKTKEYDQYGRGYRLGQTYLHKFEGKPLLGGTIREIGAINPPGSDFFNIQVTIDKIDERGRTTTKYINYDVTDDEWDEGIEGASRADARTLSLIAQKVNPDTKYTNINKEFKVHPYQY